MEQLWNYCDVSSVTLTWYYIGVNTYEVTWKQVEHIPREHPFINTTRTSTEKIRTHGTFRFWVPKRESLGGGYTVQHNLKEHEIRDLTKTHFVGLNPRFQTVPKSSPRWHDRCIGVLKRNQLWKNVSSRFRCDNKSFRFQGFSCQNFTIYGAKNIYSFQRFQWRYFRIEISTIYPQMKTFVPHVNFIKIAKKWKFQKLYMGWVLSGMSSYV